MSFLDDFDVVVYPIVNRNNPSTQTHTKIVMLQFISPPAPYLKRKKMWTFNDSVVTIFYQNLFTSTAELVRLFLSTFDVSNNTAVCKVYKVGHDFSQPGLLYFISLYNYILDVEVVQWLACSPVDPVVMCSNPYWGRDMC